MRTFNKMLLGAMVAASAIAGTAISTGASAAVVTLHTGNIPTSTTAFDVTFDELIISSIAPNPTIVITDLDGNGVIDGTFGDSFSETGLVFTFGFQLAGAPVFGSGLNASYFLFAPYSLTGAVGIIGPNIVAPFVASSATIYYDESFTGAPDGNSVALGTMSLPPGSGDCTLPVLSAADGTCELTGGFAAAAGGVGTPIWEFMGLDLASFADVFLNIDINIDEIGPAATVAAFPALVPDGPCAPGTCTTTLTVTHDGSARILVPEPGTLALLGGALFGLVLFRRRRGSH